MRIGKGRERWGEGVQVTPESLGELQWNPLRLEDFSGGYATSFPELPAPLNINYGGQDSEINKSIRIVRSPGTSQMELTGGGKKPTQLIVHPSLDAHSELLVLAPPYVGRKFDSDIAWIYSNLDSGAFFWAAYADILLFSNGIKVWKHVAGNAIVTLETTVGIADAFAVWAGRFWKGASTIDENYEPLSVEWSGINNYNDFDPVNGYGFEFLTQDSGWADRVVSLKPMSFDYMAVLNRHSIWAAKRTGDLYEPADITPVVAGEGCASQRTAWAAKGGVLYLSDDGLKLFNGNDTAHKSGPIDGELEDVLKASPNSIWGRYNPSSQRYYLGVPNQGTYVLDLRTERWSHRRLQVVDSASFAEQHPPITWESSEGTWGEQTETWKEQSTTEASVMDQVFVGQNQDAAYSLEKEVYGAETQFGFLHRPTYHFPVKQDPSTAIQMIQYSRLTVKYKGEGTLKLNLPNEEGVFGLVAVMSLPLSTKVTLKTIKLPWSGLGLGCELEIGSGKPEIEMIELRYRPLGEKVELYAEG